MWTHDLGPSSVMVARMADSKLPDHGLQSALESRVALDHRERPVEQVALVPLWAEAGLPWKATGVTELCAALASVVGSFTGQLNFLTFLHGPKGKVWRMVIVMG